ncbi:hypothetical protein ANASTE_01066 [Anaerofustis stercorihominis DSM 17244]|uniref:Recombinase domain-containing protein n=1 Tax=Anaerofustis stercorihominis DSM 17244 TaxID=445971 RepID=B1CAS0_9FIRM|nr:hypothetical protein [Anaerofustis stercorihominis]EDS71367.1 hypothetical protein ANASTE_01066 [Anaerofustis stercorihominis DSM 17244]
MKAPDDKNHWIIDEPDAEVVKEIFHLCMQGNGPTQIDNILRERQVLTPVDYAKTKGLPLAARKDSDDPYDWKDST